MWKISRDGLVPPRRLTLKLNTHQNLTLCCYLCKTTGHDISAHLFTIVLAGKHLALGQKRVNHPICQQ